jgi:hypothetical protein
MTMLLAFTPFLIFLVLERVVSVEVGLVGAAVTALALLGKDVLVHKQSAKVLEVGTVLLFGGLATYGATLHGAAWSTALVRLSVDGGLLAIVLVSLAIRRPFTLQYARESVPRELWTQPAFVRINYVITSVWAAAFAAIFASDVAWVMRPAMPTAVMIVVTLVAMAGAFKFTSWYPAYARGKMPQPAQ